MLRFLTIRKGHKDILRRNGYIDDLDFGGSFINVCTSVSKGLKTMYIKQVEFCVCQLYLTNCLKINNTPRPHPVTHTTHKPLTHTETPLHEQRITYGQTQHTNNIKRRNMHTETQVHTHVLHIFRLHGLLLELYIRTFHKEGNTLQLCCPIQQHLSHVATGDLKYKQCNRRIHILLLDHLN